MSIRECLQECVDKEMLDYEMIVDDHGIMKRIESAYPWGGEMILEVMDKIEEVVKK